MRTVVWVTARTAMTAGGATRWAQRAALGVALLVAPCGPAAAQVRAADPTVVPSTQEERVKEAQAAWRAAYAASTRGPASVPLLDEARLQVPAGMVFIPPGEAGRWLTAQGNQPGTNLVGIVVTPRVEDEWMVVIRHTSEGHVRDDDASSLNADEVLASLREGTEEGNKDRVARGFAPLQLLGWTQPPTYDAKAHRLSWAMRVKAADEDENDIGVNFNTRALGREGYFSLNLITSQERIEADRPVAAQLLSNLDYKDGKRYADYNASTDHLAEYGLAGLIGVVAAKKLGLLALLAVFLAKFAKVGILAVLGLGAVFTKLFRRTPRA